MSFLANIHTVAHIDSTIAQYNERKTQLQVQIAALDQEHKGWAGLMFRSDRSQLPAKPQFAHLEVEEARVAALLALDRVKAEAYDLEMHLQNALARKAEILQENSDAADVARRVDGAAKARRRGEQEHYVPYATFRPMPAAESNPSDSCQTTKTIASGLCLALFFIIVVWLDLSTRK